MRLLWLPWVLRDAGLTVYEEPGWSVRGRDDADRPYGPLRGVVCHATASSRTSAVRTDIDVLCYIGSATAPAPISQLYLARSGEWWVLASGRCNHVRTGWAGPFQGLGNTNLVGIEAANDDAGEPWPFVQYESYVRGVAAILRHTGWPPPVGHKEHQPGAKVDPTFDMNVFRGRVAEELTGGSTVDFEDVCTALGDGTTKAGTVEEHYPNVWGHLKGRTLTDLKAAIGARPPAPDVDVDALAAVLEPFLEQVAEKAVRKVLGAVDGAVPPQT